MQPIYRKPLTFSEAFMPSPSRALCAVAVVGLAALATFAYRWLQPRTPAGIPLNFLQLDPIHEALINYGASKVDYSSPLSVREHSYRTYGPVSYVVDNRGSAGDEVIPGLLDAYFAELKKAPIIVNLISEGEQIQHWYSSNLKHRVEALKHEVIHCFRFSNWESRQALQFKQYFIALDEAKKVAQLVQSNPQEITVIGMDSSARTTGFIAMIELFRDPKILGQDLETIRKFIFETLHELCYKQRQPIPSRDEIQMLFSESFIKQAKIT